MLLFLYVNIPRNIPCIQIRYTIDRLMILDTRVMPAMTRTFGTNTLHPDAVVYIVDVPGDSARCTVVAVDIDMYIVSDNGSERASSHTMFDDIRACGADHATPRYAYKNIARVDTPDCRAILQKNMHRIAWMRRSMSQSPTCDDDDDNSSSENEFDDTRECFVVRTTCIGSGRIFSVVEAINDSRDAPYVGTGIFMHSHDNPLAWTALAFDSGRAQPSQIQCSVFSPIIGLEIPFVLATHSFVAAIVKHPKVCFARIPRFSWAYATFQLGVLAMLEYIDSDILEITQPLPQSAPHRLMHLFRYTHANMSGCDSDVAHDSPVTRLVSDDTVSESSTTSTIVRCPRTHRIVTFLVDVTMAPITDPSRRPHIELAILGRHNNDAGQHQCIHPVQISLAKLAVSVVLYQPCGMSKIQSSAQAIINIGNEMQFVFSLMFNGETMFPCIIPVAHSVSPDESHTGIENIERATARGNFIRFASKQRTRCQIHANATISIGPVVIHKGRGDGEINNMPVYMHTIDKNHMTKLHTTVAQSTVETPPMKQVSDVVTVNAHCAQFITNRDHTCTIVNNTPAGAAEPQTFQTPFTTTEMKYINDMRDRPWAVAMSLSPVYAYAHTPIPLSLLLDANY